MRSTTCHFRASSCCKPATTFFFAMQVESVQLLAWKGILFNNHYNYTFNFCALKWLHFIQPYRYLHKRTWSSHHIRSMRVDAWTHMIRNLCSNQIHRNLYYFGFYTLWPHFTKKKTLWPLVWYIRNQSIQSFFFFLEIQIYKEIDHKMDKRFKNFMFDLSQNWDHKVNDMWVERCWKAMWNIIWIGAKCHCYHSAMKWRDNDPTSLTFACSLYLQRYITLYMGLFGYVNNDV